MSACLFTVSVASLRKMTDRELMEFRAELIRLLGTEYDSGNRFESDRHAGADSSLTMACYEQVRRERIEWVNHKRRKRDAATPRPNA